jgi:hypothetical protein
VYEPCIKISIFEFANYILRDILQRGGEVIRPHFLAYDDGFSGTIRIFNIFTSKENVEISRITLCHGVSQSVFIFRMVNFLV